jgi:hypothetical protein
MLTPPTTLALTATTTLAVRLSHHSKGMRSPSSGITKKLTKQKKSGKLYPVMRDRKTYTITWKDEDSNRVSSKDFTNKEGIDHSGMDEALAIAQQADTNMWPWVLEEDGTEVAHGWGGDQMGNGRLFPTCG